MNNIPQPKTPSPYLFYLAYLASEEHTCTSLIIHLVVSCFTSGEPFDQREIVILVFQVRSFPSAPSLYISYPPFQSPIRLPLGDQQHWMLHWFQCCWLWLRYSWRIMVPDQSVQITRSWSRNQFTGQWTPLDNRADSGAFEKTQWRKVQQMKRKSDPEINGPDTNAAGQRS